jgi:hypothetical protein
MSKSTKNESSEPRSLHPKVHGMTRGKGKSARRTLRLEKFDKESNIRQALIRKGVIRPAKERSYDVYT